MRNSKRMLTAAVFVLIGVLLALTACAPQTAALQSADSGSGATDSWPVGSMMALHEEGVINLEKEYAKKDCLSCHPRDAIVAATKDYGSEAGVNPHAAHTEAYDCMVCHSLAETSSMKCNGCHDWHLPDGWESPPKESGVQ